MEVLVLIVCFILIQYEGIQGVKPQKSSKLKSLNHLAPPSSSPDQDLPPFCIVPLPPSPLEDAMPSPPVYVPCPPDLIPPPPLDSSGTSPPTDEFVPVPPVLFLPPVVYPPPLRPPPRPSPPPEASRGLWCVAKPAVPDRIIQEAMDYACGKGADCKSIQPDGTCYQPDTVLAHASFAFNSYWQWSKVAGGTCDFGGTAMLVTEDPSYEGCHFIIT